ncbi:MAG: RibD family protein [Candidatus Undinarchaeales archaeon]|nr:RibD family protein [Candidatus Undinarchaeales archaeon]MDP7492340.1 RibD family protein [Candidatus Undinarchaeales archaeon]
MLPRVIIHNASSIDGRITGFMPNLGVYYGLVHQWGEDATLAGADTILAGPELFGEEVPPETPDDLKPWKIAPDDDRPLLVIPDSRGRVRMWHHLRNSGIWRDVVALVSMSTPREYIDYLKERNIATIVAGDDHVDMCAALKELNQRYGVRIVRMDSGGTLNGVMLRAGLVDEVSVLVHPCLVGDTQSASIFNAVDLENPAGIIKARLLKAEELKDGIVWLRYEIEI